MIVMPANSTGWFWHALARETGRIGHLYSPGAQNGPWPWFPYACDNGAFSCWDRRTNTFDRDEWSRAENRWHRLMVWTQVAAIKPRWAIVPDVPGDAINTMAKWIEFAPHVTHCPRALAVQDGMTPDEVRALPVKPDVIAVGGTDDFKRGSWREWVTAFPRVHVLRVNVPEWLYELEAAGVESCDGTGWNRGNRKQTRGVEEWARSKANPNPQPMWMHTCRQPRNKNQETFA